jgi:protein subunit release factor B/cell division protein ZapA (FtsZ GTPase activity inhibitor)
MYTRFAERRNWSVETMSVSDASAGGFKEITGLVRGKDVYALLKWESGVHRVQRVPATEAQGRIHTSTATVAIMPEAEEVDVVLQTKDLEISFMRASGAGGQSVNTTDSAVRIVHVPTGIAVHTMQEKSQTKNREIAMRLLRSRLLDREIQRVNAERAAQRKGQIGTGERSEKVRTYNYPQDRVSDHRINLTRHALPDFMDGDLGDVIAALRASDEAQRLAEAQASELAAPARPDQVTAAPALRYRRRVKRSVQVEIAGQQLTIRSDEGAEYVHQLADYVDAHLRVPQRRPADHQPAGLQRVALLVAMQLADELFREKDLHQRFRRRVGDKLEVLRRAIDDHEQRLAGPSTPAGPARPA